MDTAVALGIVGKRGDAVWLYSEDNECSREWNRPEKRSSSSVAYFMPQVETLSRRDLLRNEKRKRAALVGEALLSLDG